METPLLVSTDWLALHLNDPLVRVADVRWYLFEKDKTGQSEYARGHIPSAVFFDMDTELAAPPAKRGGRHPLPSPETFARAASRAGITPETHVIAYDDRGGATAGRLWWLLKYFGHEKVSLLDGGIVRWIAEGRALQTETPQVPPANFIPHPHPEMFVDHETVNALRSNPHTLILDVRVPERFRGEIEPIDPKAGHVPGAKNAPIGGNLQSATDPRFRAPAELRARFEKLGANDAKRIVPYCGSGVNACQMVFALRLAGFDNVMLYAGSWSDWSNEPNLPVATGDE